MAYQHHVLDVFGVHLFLASTPKQWRKLRKAASFVDKKPPTSVGLSHFAVWHPTVGLQHGCLVIWVDRKAHTDPGELIDTVAHEAAHGATQVLEYVGHEFRAPVDETHAYLVGWLTRWVWEHVAPVCADPAP